MQRTDIPPVPRRGRAGGSLSPQHLVVIDGVGGTMIAMFNYTLALEDRTGNHSLLLTMIDICCAYPFQLVTVLGQEVGMDSEESKKVQQQLM